MLFISIWAILVALIGLVIYVVSGNPKVSTIGLVLFSCGVLAALFMLGGSTVRIGGR